MPRRSAGQKLPVLGRNNFKESKQSKAVKAPKAVNPHRPEDLYSEELRCCLEECMMQMYPNHQFNSDLSTKLTGSMFNYNNPYRLYYLFERTITRHYNKAFIQRGLAISLRDVYTYFDNTLHKKYNKKESVHADDVEKEFPESTPMSYLSYALMFMYKQNRKFLDVKAFKDVFFYNIPTPHAKHVNSISELTFYPGMPLYEESQDDAFINFKRALTLVTARLQAEALKAGDECSITIADEDAQTFFKFNMLPYLTYTYELEDAGKTVETVAKTDETDETDETDLECKFCGELQCEYFDGISAMTVITL